MFIFHEYFLLLALGQGACACARSRNERPVRQLSWAMCSKSNICCSLINQYFIGTTVGHSHRSNQRAFRRFFLIVVRSVHVWLFHFSINETITVNDFFFCRYCCCRSFLFLHNERSSLGLCLPHKRTKTIKFKH